MIKYYNRVRLNMEIWKHIQKTGIVIDIGCGLEPQRFFKPVFCYFIEPHKPYALEMAKRCNNHHSIVLNNTIQDISSGVLKEVDTAFMLDVLEHIDKAEGKAIIKRLEQNIKQQIVLRIPLGFIPQEIDVWGKGGEKWQKHRSAWFPKDFDKSWDILVSKHYIYIRGDGSVNKPPTGEFYAIKNIKNGNSFATVSLKGRLIVFVYDVGMVIAWSVLRILPKSLAESITLYVINRLWRRIGL